MENPETLATYGTQEEEKQNKKHNTICVIHHYTQTNTTQYVLYTTIHKHVKLSHLNYRNKQTYGEVGQ